ncbi:MAG: hypothetical protein JWL59_4142 [Chthoniobacteraceae bacterium]|nr:hypothetical protein [Chthoniobacteraceae bacterium]
MVRVRRLFAMSLPSPNSQPLPDASALPVPSFAPPPPPRSSGDGNRILYCHCQYAQVVPREVKETVLRRLCQEGVAFEAVADLCEMAARHDPALHRLAADGALKIAACYPRAVKGLFHQAGADLPAASTEVINMRVQPAEEVLSALLGSEIKPNLPVKESRPNESASRTSEPRTS